MSKSKLVGGTMMVAGTSIGAAMIAMPVSAAKIGFVYSLILLLIISFVMYYVAQISLQIYKITDSNFTMSKIAGEILSKPFQILCSIATLVLLYSLLVAYISGLSEILASNLKNNDYIINVISITFILSVSLGYSSKMFDYYNRSAFSLKILCMGIMICLLLPNVSINQLVVSNQVMISQLGIIQILTVFVTSFGFHAGIPFIYKFLNSDGHLYRKSVLYGIVATFIIYILWLVITFGVVSQQQLFSANDSVSNLISLLNSEVKFTGLEHSITAFVFLAILTSLFGVAAAVFDFLEEFLREKFNFKNRFIISSITFIPPALFAVTDKSLFIKALSLAGCCLTILAIIIPSMIRFKLKSETEKFSPFLLIICFIIGILTILGELISL